MGLPENRVPKYVMINHLFPTRWVTNFQTRKKIMLKLYDPPFSSLIFPSKPPFSSGDFLCFMADCQISKWPYTPDPRPLRAPLEMGPRHGPNANAGLDGWPCQSFPPRDGLHKNQAAGGFLKGRAIQSTILWGCSGIYHAISCMHIYIHTYIYTYIHIYIYIVYILYTVIKCCKYNWLDL